MEKMSGQKRDHKSASRRTHIGEDPTRFLPGLALSHPDPSLDLMRHESNILVKAFHHRIAHIDRFHVDRANSALEELLHLLRSLGNRRARFVHGLSIDREVFTSASCNGPRSRYIEFGNRGRAGARCVRRRDGDGITCRVGWDGGRGLRWVEESVV